jgi:Spondin_N
MIVGERQFNTTDSQHLPPINVTFEHPFLSSMVKLTPSPDWFAGFSDFKTINPATETYYEQFVIRSFVWDAGTDDGQKYTALDRDLDPQWVVTRMTLENVPPMGQFLSPDGTFIPHPCEFECILRVDDRDIVPGKPFDELEDIRPPLYVDRVGYDNFIEGDDKKSDGKGGAAITMIMMTTVLWSGLAAATFVTAIW